MRRIIERDAAIRVIRVARISVKRCCVRMERFKNRRSLILYSLRAPPLFFQTLLNCGQRCDMYFETAFKKYAHSSNGPLNLFVPFSLAFIPSFL